MINDIKFSIGGNIMKKNNRGITMISLTIYVVIIGIVIAILAAFKNNFDDTLDSMDEYTSLVPEFNKMHMYMLDEVNLENNKVLKKNADGTYIEFSSGNTYTFSDNKIFKNNVKIFSDIESCSFELGKENENDVLLVNLSVGIDEKIGKQLKYVFNEKL